MNGGTQVRRHEFRGAVGEDLAIEVEALMGVVADIIGVVLQFAPRKDLEEATQGGDISPYYAREDGITWCL